MKKYIGNLINLRTAMNAKQKEDYEDNFDYVFYSEGDESGFDQNK